MSDIRNELAAECNCDETKHCVTCRASAEIKRLRTRLGNVTLWRDEYRARLEELETENAICRAAIEDAVDLVTGWCDTHDSDSDSACGRVALRQLGEAIGKACPRLLMEKPEGQKLYGLHWHELQERLREAEQLLLGWLDGGCHPGEIYGAQMIKATERYFKDA